VSAPTGSGKTLGSKVLFLLSLPVVDFMTNFEISAFVIPIVQALKSRVVPRVRALVILPVQELATQVKIYFQLLSKNGKAMIAYK